MRMVQRQKYWFMKWTAAMVAVVMLGVIPHFSKLIVKAESEADVIVSVALGEEGYTEGSNNDNKYGAYFNQNNVAWCALFISWCARQAGIPTSIIKTTAWAGDMGSSQRTGNFGSQYYPKGSVTPQKGDIVYYDWNKNGSSDHVEIVISINESSKTFTSIGGNTKGDSGSTEGVRRHSNYSFTSSYIVGFERPNYNGSVTPPSNDDELGIPYPRPQVSSTVWLGKNGITSGDYVKWLQTALNKADNAGLAVDGQFGSGTTAAVKSFQEKHDLTQDGQAGTATINKLVEVIKSGIRPTLDAPNLNVDVNGQDVTLSWNLVENATHYDVRIYYKDGTSYQDYWGGSETQSSLTVTLPANTEFKAQVCSANKYYENCWTYCQPVTFKTGANLYVITFDSNGGSCPTIETPVTNGTAYGTLPTPTKKGYDFDGWYTAEIGGTEITSDTIVSITENQTLYAHWSETYYTVYFDANGGISDDLSLVYPPYYKLASASREGYKFLGWYTEKEGGTLVTIDNIYNLLVEEAVDCLCIYAHWEKIEIPSDLNSDSTLADLNADGTVNGFDLALLRQKLLA